MKVCKDCKEELNSDNRAGRYLLCKPCRNRRQREYLISNPEKYEAHKKSAAFHAAKNARKYLYGISDEKFQEMLSEQKGLCAICMKVPATHVDHDHRCCTERYTCGKCVRKLLCRDCNLLLAYAKENTDTLSRAIEYLS